ncbi:MAG TPA: hypothetical protein DEH78_18115 [Solibacterales bacterium]|nr:hypothetical protein [Bryobacterales bacterium]
MAALPCGLLSGGRGNIVQHVDPRDGGVKLIMASQGSCRHHLLAHPADTVMTAAGPAHDATMCN